MGRPRKPSWPSPDLCPPAGTPLPHARPDEAAARVSPDHDPRPARAPPARPGVGPASEPNELQLADQSDQVADDMGDGLHEHRSPSPAELDAWACALHRLDRASGSRQSDGRTGAETRLGKGQAKVRQKLGSLARERRPWNLLNDEIAAAAASPVGAGAWGTA